VPRVLEANHPGAQRAIDDEVRATTQSTTLTPPTVMPDGAFVAVRSAPPAFDKVQIINVQ